MLSEKMKKEKRDDFVGECQKTLKDLSSYLDRCSWKLAENDLAKRIWIHLNSVLVPNSTRIILLVLRWFVLAYHYHYYHYYYFM